MMPTLSIIIPVYKVEAYLNRCVESVLKQSFTDFELLLVDDGSPDNSGALCDQYAAQDTRVQVIHKSNGGVSSARNAGLEQARGEYIAFVDSDDWIEPEMYERMIGTARDHNCDVVMCDCVKEFPDHQLIYTHDIRAGFYNKAQLKEEYYPVLLTTPDVEYPATISNWVILFRRVMKCGMAMPRYLDGVRFSEDWLFGSQLLYQANSFYYMKGENYYHYFMNATSASHSFAVDKWEDYKKLFAAAVDYFSEASDYNFQPQLDRMLLFLTYNAFGEAIRAESFSPKQRRCHGGHILSEPMVRKMFERLNIRTLKIPAKQKIITMCYKWQLVWLLHLYTMIK